MKKFLLYYGGLIILTYFCGMFITCDISWLWKVYFWDDYHYDIESYNRFPAEFYRLAILLGAIFVGYLAKLLRDES